MIYLFCLAVSMFYQYENLDPLSYVMEFYLLFYSEWEFLFRGGKYCRKC
jgi:hypothetical protein